MLNEPLLNRFAVVAGAVAGDQGAILVGVGLIHSVEQRLEAGGAAGRSGSRELRTIKVKGALRL